jgi:hypothetical protein
MAQSSSHAEFFRVPIGMGETAELIMLRAGICAG